MPLTASKMATCTSTYTRAVISPLALTVGLARIAFSALRFHSVTTSCAEEAAFSIRESANRQRTPHGQVWEARFLISQLVFIKSSMPGTSCLAIVVADCPSSPGTRRVYGEHRLRLCVSRAAYVHSSQIECFLRIKSFCRRTLADRDYLRFDFLIAINYPAQKKKGPRRAF